MQIIRNTADINQYKSKIYHEYFGSLTAITMDIETTGLYPNSSEIILGGLLQPLNNKGQVTDKGEIIQYFADKTGSEAELLESYATDLSTKDVLITYNGAGFDLPFLKYRLKKYGMNIDLDSIQSFDLYRALHRHSKMRDILPDLKQKSIENFLGLSHLRKDEISGGESVVLYNEYLRTGSGDILEKILLHNKDDLVQLSLIMKILDRLDLHKILFHEGFTISGSNNNKVIVTSITMKKKHLTVTARTCNVNLDYYSFESGYQAIHKSKEKEMTLSIPYEEKNQAMYIDLESLNMDFSNLEGCPGFESGFLILQDKGIISYAEINKTLRIIFTEFLDKLML